MGAEQCRHGLHPRRNPALTGTPPPSALTAVARIRHSSGGRQSRRPDDRATRVGAGRCGIEDHDTRRLAGHLERADVRPAMVVGAASAAAPGAVGRQGWGGSARGRGCRPCCCRSCSPSSSVPVVIPRVVPGRRLTVPGRSRRCCPRRSAAYWRWPGFGRSRGWRAERVLDRCCGRREAGWRTGGLLRLAGWSRRWSGRGIRRQLRSARTGAGPRRRRGDLIRPAARHGSRSLAASPPNGVRVWAASP